MNSTKFLYIYIYIPDKATCKPMIVGIDKPTINHGGDIKYTFHVYYVKMIDWLCFMAYQPFYVT